jgi:hypothetical protein
MARGGRTLAPTTATIDRTAARRRAEAYIAERRRRQDLLIDAVTDALATRETALAAIEASRASLDESIAALAGLGIGREEVATILGIPVHELGSEPRRRSGGSGIAARAEPAPTVARAAAEGDSEDGAVKLWLGMIERGRSPKTHGIDGDGGLLCRGTGDLEHLTTWTGYAFDVDCQSCAKLLAEQLTEEEFG